MLVFFSAPFFTQTIVFGSEGYLTTVFAKHYELDLVVLGGFLTAIGIFDTITDPAIGVLSDNVRTRFGRRKPWIVLGAFSSLVCCYFLFTPPFTVTLGYFLLWYFLLQLSQTFYFVPKQAWAVELTRDYYQRTRVFTFRNVAAGLGRMGFLLIPLLPFMSSTAMTPEVFEVAFFIGLVIFPVSIFFLVSRVPESTDANDAQSPDQEKLTISLVLDLVRKNPPFLYYLVCQTFIGLGVGMYSAHAFLYYDTYLRIGDKVSAIGLSLSVLAILAAPFWLKVAQRLGDKRRLMAVCGFLAMSINIPLAFLNPGEYTFAIYLALTSFAVLAAGGIGIANPSIFGDVIDYGTWRLKHVSAATYTSVWSVLFKLERSTAAGLAFLLVGLFGYDPSSDSNTPTAILGLKLVHLILPAIFMTLGTVMYIRFPITPRRQATIRKRLTQRAERAARSIESR